MPTELYNKEILKEFNGDIIMWGAHWDWPHYLPQQMAKYMAKHKRVLYVNMPSVAVKWLLPNRWGRLMKPWKEFFDIIRPLRKVDNNLFVYTPPPLILPYAHFKKIDTGCEVFHFEVVKKVAKRLGIMWQILWNPPFFLGDLNIKKYFQGAFICYDCIGETQQWTRYGTKRGRLQNRENSFLDYVDVVITSAPTLSEKIKNIHRNVHYLPPGADVLHYSKALNDETQIPADINALPRPRIGYFGTMSNQKTDWTIIRFVAKSHPEWSIVLIGPIANVPNVNFDDLDNIYFLGMKSVSVLPAYVKAFDVCLIPFPQDEFGKYAFPTKTFEYLASGKPVVSTDLPALREYQPLIKVAKSKEEFLQFVEESLTENDKSLVQKRIELARNHTWGNRAKKAIELIELTMNRNFNNRRFAC